jgi:glycogen phosphorylase
MTLKETGGGTASFEARLSTHRPAGDYTVRVLPQHADARQPLEMPLVLWER